MKITILVCQFDNIIFIHKQDKIGVCCFEESNFVFSFFKFSLKMANFEGKHTFASIVIVKLNTRFSTLWSMMKTWDLKLHK